MNIEVKHNRFGLEEGRSRGMAFGFLKRIEKGKYETVMPISPCKDYLNDVIYYCKTGSRLSKVYGFEYFNDKDINNKNYYFLGLQFVNYTHESINALTERELSDFKKNYKKVESFLREIDNIIGINYKTKIYPANDNLFIVKMPVFWSEKPYLLSMYTLLLRAFQAYDGSLSALKTIELSKTHPDDTFLMDSIVRKTMLKILKGEGDPQNWGDTSDRFKVHNELGIASISRHEE